MASATAATEMSGATTYVNGDANTAVSQSSESRTATPDEAEKGRAVEVPDFLSEDYDPKEMQEVVREAILLAGGAVTVLLQIANPGVGRGVNEHSNFAYRPIDRLRTTMTYVYSMAFGTAEEKKTVIEMVHRAHSTVKGEGYSADDVDLQLWVAATLYASGLDIYEKIFGKLDEEKADLVYQQYAVLSATLRVPPEMWPKDRKAFWEYWDSKINSFPITPHAIKVSQDILWNKKVPLWVRVNMPALRIITAEWLPPYMRDAYGLKNSKSQKMIYKMLMGVTKTVYPRLPMALRQYPKNYYLKDMRRRMNQVQKSKKL